MKNNKIKTAFHEITESHSVGSLVEFDIRVTLYGSYFEQEDFALSGNSMSSALARDEQNQEVLWQVLYSLNCNQPEALKLIDAVRNRLLED